MDITSALHKVRGTGPQKRANLAPAGTPPTIKFLAVALLVGMMVLGFAVLVMSYEPAAGDGSVLNVSDSPQSETTSSPSPKQGLVADAQHGPQPDDARGA